MAGPGLGRNRSLLGGFLQGFTGTYALMDRANREHQRLKMDEEESKLKRRLLELNIQKATDVQGIQGQLAEAFRNPVTRPQPMAGGPAQHVEGPEPETFTGDVPAWTTPIQPGPVPNAQVTDEPAQAQRIKALLMQTPPGLEAASKALFATETQDPLKAAQADFLRQFMGGQPGASPMPGMGAPAPTPVASPTAPPMAPQGGMAPAGQFRPESITIGGVKLGVPTYQYKDIQIPAAPGVMIPGLIQIDPQGLQQPQIIPLPVGAPATDAQKSAAVALHARGISLLNTPGPQYTQILNEYASILGLPEQQRGAKLEDFDRAIGTWMQNRTGGGPAFGDIPTVMEGSRKRAMESDVEKERRIAEARRGERELSIEESKAIFAMTNIQNDVDYLLNTFKPDEIKKFVGLLRRPMQEVMLILRDIQGEGGSERYAEFKSQVTRLKGTAFGEGGKQLTPFEAKVVFGYTPTGEETFAEFMAKAANLKKFAQLSRDVRSSLARTPQKDLSNESIDAALRAAMARAGLKDGGTTGSDVAVPPGYIKNPRR